MVKKLILSQRLFYLLGWGVILCTTGFFIINAVFPKSNFRQGLAAVESREHDLLRTIFERDSSLVRAVDVEGRTLLWHAASLGEKNAVLFLLHAGVDPLVSGRHGYGTALHAAAVEGELEVLRVLVDRTGSVDVPDARGMTPLWHAVIRQDMALIRHLVEDFGADPHAKALSLNLLHASALRGFDEAVRFFLSKGVGVDDQDSQGFTPLHYAASVQSASTEKILLAAGADPAIRATDGSTAADIRSNDFYQLFGPLAREAMQTR